MIGPLADNDHSAAYSENGVPTQEFYNAIGIYLGIWW